MRRLVCARSARAFALLAGVALVACAEEESGPQFANDPAPTRPPLEATTLASPAPLPTVAAAATPASVTDLLVARGAPNRVFVASDNTIWSVTSTGESMTLFESPVESRILAIDAAPGGQQVAALLLTTAAERETTDVVILDSAGETVTRIGDLGALVATPVPGQFDPEADAIDWSPQGDRVLVSYQSGVIVEFAIGAERDLAVLTVDAAATALVSPAWSPTGESIAFISASEAGRKRTLKLLHVGDGSIEDIVVPPDGRFVVDFAWMPNGNSLLFTEGGELGGAVSGIDLWRVDADGENRELVVSAGTVAPVARITNIQPSTDGRSVAYSVLVPGTGSPQVDSVWVRDLESRLGFRIPASPVAAVDEIWWTDQGLALSILTTGTPGGPSASRALLEVNRDGTAGVLWAAPIAAGTPVSGTPAATPVSG